MTVQDGIGWIKAAIICAVFAFVVSEIAYHVSLEKGFLILDNFRSITFIVGYVFYMIFALIIYLCMKADRRARADGRQ